MARQSGKRYLLLMPLLDGGNTVHLNQSVAEYANNYNTSQENIFCNVCTNNVKPTARCQFISLPDILIINLGKSEVFQMDDTNKISNKIGNKSAQFDRVKLRSWKILRMSLIIAVIDRVLQAESSKLKTSKDVSKRTKK